MAPSSGMGGTVGGVGEIPLADLVIKYGEKGIPPDSNNGVKDKDLSGGEGGDGVAVRYGGGAGWMGRLRAAAAAKMRRSFFNAPAAAATGVRGPPEGGSTGNNSGNANVTSGVAGNTSGSNRPLAPA